MNPRMLVACAFITLGIGVSVVGQARPSFAGHWRPVTATDGTSDLFISQDATTLTIGHPHGDGQHRSTYDLTGQEHTSPNPGHPSEHDVSTTRWEGSTLRIDVRLSNGVRLTQRLSLDRDGTLVFESTTVFPDGRPSEESRSVFRKQMIMTPTSVGVRVRALGHEGQMEAGR